MAFQNDIYDVVVVGGGPSGSTSALCCARKGLKTLLLEKDEHPRFHIGESLLPRNYTLFRELGLLERIERLPHVPKYGATFVMGNAQETTDFWFAKGPRGEDAQSMSVERAPFDRLLLKAAMEAGAEIHERTGVKSIDRLADGDVALSTTRGPVRARVLLDASGQSTIVGRHLGTRSVLPDLKRVAYYQHFEGVERRPGKLGGSPIIVMCTEGWYWVIPIDESRTSIGLVVSAEVIKRAGVAPAEALSWGIERTPYMRSIMKGARGCSTNHVTADFSYRCEPFAGPGYFLVGDAATFVDPIFSTGVGMGMMSAVKAAEAAERVIAEPGSAERVRREYIRYVEGSSAVFFRLVRGYYTHGFREMFLNGRGPLGMHKAILQMLAGHVFPRPVFAHRWRVGLFHLLRKVHDAGVTLVPRRAEFSLLDQPEPVRVMAAEGARETVGAGA